MKINKNGKMFEITNATTFFENASPSLWAFLRFYAFLQKLEKCWLNK